MSKPGSEPAAVVERLREATNAHDLEAIVACSAAEYHNETSLHPARGFTGCEQVRRNWTQILAAPPEVSTEIVASTAPPETRFGARGSTVALARTASADLCRLLPGAGPPS